MRNRNIIYCLLALLLVSCNKVDNRDPFYERDFYGTGDQFFLKMVFHEDGTCTVRTTFNPFKGQTLNRAFDYSTWTWDKDEYGNLSMTDGERNFLGCELFQYFLFFKSARVKGDKITIECSRTFAAVEMPAPLSDMTVELVRQ